MSAPSDAGRLSLTSYGSQPAAARANKHINLMRPSTDIDWDVAAHRSCARRWAAAVGARGGMA
jgi:hypothetical protein